MPLDRTLEPEVMDSLAEALDYNAMDHAEVNRRFVEDLLATGADLSNVLDLGTGTALIPIELCNAAPTCEIVAVDAAGHMLRVARQNIAGAGFEGRIHLQQIDAKRLPYRDGTFSSVISNSIVHHIPEPFSVLKAAVRVCATGGVLFFRDLLRPDDLTVLRTLVDTYAADATEHQRQMFANSLHAALSLDEIRVLVGSLGFSSDDVHATSDRHWTWTARKR